MNKGVLHNGMSLFHDLKLKRRKFDSRCSSDGESIGTSESTSSLSPDTQPQGGEGSPKAEKERCNTPEESVVTPGGQGPKSNGFTSNIFLMMQNGCERNKRKYDELEGVRVTSATVTTANVLVVKSEPGGDDARSTLSLSPGPEEQEHPRKTPLKRRPLKEAKSPPSAYQMTNGHNGHSASNGHMTNGSTTNGHSNSNGHGSDSESVGSIRSEKLIIDSDKYNGKIEEKEEKMDEDDELIIKENAQYLSSSPRSALSSASSTGSRGSPPRPNNIQNLDHSHPQHPGMTSSPSPSRRSPPHSLRDSTLIITKASNKEESFYRQRSSPMSHHSSSNSSRGGSPPQQILSSHLLGHPLPPHNMINSLHQPSGFFHGNQLHDRLTGNRRERDNHYNTNNNTRDRVHVEIRSLSDKSNSRINNGNYGGGEPPLSVVTSTSLSFHQSSTYRINGVRPEVISGGAVTPTVAGATNGNSVGGSSPPLSQASLPPQALHPHHQLQHHHQLLPNGTTAHHPHTNNSIINNIVNGHSLVSNGHITNNQHNNLQFQGNRKSPTHLNSRSPNSSPNTSSSCGSVQHSPGSTGSAAGGNATIIAGGNIGMVNSSTGNNGTHHVNLSRTPTVIMGEAGGVRTMIWSTPDQPIPNPALEIGLRGTSPPGSTGNSSVSSNGSISYGMGNGNTNGTNNSNSSMGNNNNNTTLNSHPAMQKGVLSMERLWATTEALNLSTGASNTTNGHGPISSLTNGQMNTDDDDYEQPMICMICEDRATGLHYGIITCEGCKGFFKRTVQNRRVYTCVADGKCEITKAQRNRCQYCRFLKCIQQGMVLQAVREDRMPGGRNSGAVYNLYKVPVKYRKHKKGNRGAANGKGEKNANNNNNTTGNSRTVANCASNGDSNVSSNGQSHAHRGNNIDLSIGNGLSSPMSMLPPHPGNILMEALTRDRNEANARRHANTYDRASTMIRTLVDCDNFQDVAALHNWGELLEANGDLQDKLAKMGDLIVFRLVQWTKRLPFYSEIPVEDHTKVLTHKWHELLVLTTSAWHAINGPRLPPGLTPEQETMENLHILQKCLQAMMGSSLTLEQLKQDVGQMVDKLTFLNRTFRELRITHDEYVSLKVIAMLQDQESRQVAMIQERYINVLRTYLEVEVPSEPNRLTKLLRCLSDVRDAASLLLDSKMFYVPFLLNSALLQRPQ